MFGPDADEIDVAYYSEKAEVAALSYLEILKHKFGNDILWADMNDTSGCGRIRVFATGDAAVEAKAGLTILAANDLLWEGDLPLLEVTQPPL